MNPKFKTEYMYLSIFEPSSDITNLIGFSPISGTTSQFGGEEQIRLNDIEMLRLEVSELKREVMRLRNQRVITTKESLIHLWDNEYDERWNDL